MVKVTSPAVTQTDKEKCLAAVQKREGATLPSTSTQQTSAVDQKPVINITVDCAKIKAETDQTVSETKQIVGEAGNENKVVIKTEQEENMEVDSSASHVNLNNEKVEKMEVDSGHTHENEAKSEAEVTGLGTVSGVAMEKSSVKDSDTVSESKVQIQVSVASETESAGVTVPATVSQTDVTKPLTIETKFTTAGGTPNVSPGLLTVCFII